MSIYQVPVTKAKGQFIPVDTGDALPEAVYKYALALGLKALVNRGTSKLNREDFADDASFAAAAMEVAQKQVEGMYSGKTRIIGQKSAAKRDGAEMTEALRLAKLDVKAGMKDKGIKVSHVSAADITKAARAYVETDTEYYLSLARENLAKATGSTKSKNIDLASLIIADPAKVAKAEEKKAKSKKEVSAKQAGKTVPQKKKGGTQQVHA